MTQSDSGETNNTIYVLSLSYDNNDRSALTILANDVRFQVIADPKDLQKSSDKTFYYEYLDKLHGLRDAEQREYDVVQKQKNLESSKAQKSEDSDSAVDVTADEDEEDENQDSFCAEFDLRKWLLTGLTDVIAEYAPPNRAPEPSSLYDWYHGPTYFYSLAVKSGGLVFELLEDCDEQDARIEKLSPRMKMPQYIQKIDVPWIDAKDLTVQSEVDFPEPAHPGKVMNKQGEIFFFKLVVAADPGPIKREITFESSKTDAMGFLLSCIEEPVPLTKLLEASVSETKRANWSKKCKEYVDTLHKHSIIWGDAKADNFIVDKRGELWIIDFSGSYTEGWVDPELSDTLKGDKQGLEKIQEALKSPDNGHASHGGRSGKSRTPNPSSTVQETASSLFVTEAPKRKRSVVDDGEDDPEEQDSRVMDRKPRRRASDE